jgi:hypothetical protein
MLNQNEFIELLGGSTKVAAICGNITKSAVSQWKQKGIPKSWEYFLMEKYPKEYRKCLTNIKT